MRKIISRTSNTTGQCLKTISIRTIKPIIDMTGDAQIPYRETIIFFCLSSRIMWFWFKIRYAWEKKSLTMKHFINNNRRKIKYKKAIKKCFVNYLSVSKFHGHSPALVSGLANVSKRRELHTQEQKLTEAKSQRLCDKCGGKRAVKSWKKRINPNRTWHRDMW